MKIINRNICNFVVFNSRARKTQTKLKNSVMSVVIAVGPHVSSPDFSFSRFLETALAWRFPPQLFARPTMHHSRSCNSVSSSCETYLDLSCLVEYFFFFASFCQISTGTLQSNCSLWVHAVSNFFQKARLGRILFCSVLKLRMAS